MVGTTERVHDGDPARIAPTAEEVEYLLGVHRRYFPESRGEVVDSWAGLRVLPRAEGDAFSRPREVIFLKDDARAPSWLTVYGGKLTGYRHTAAEVLDEVRGSLPPRVTRRADTSTLVLPKLEDVDVWD